MSLVSVVMPVYNAEPYLSQSIESILKQTLKDFEFIIINDGSTDNTAKILDTYSARDSRIKVVHQENHGVTYSLNKAVSLATSSFIARMDADDISARTRLEEQFDYLMSHDDYVLVGTDFTVIDKHENILRKVRVANKDADLRVLMYINSPLAHGSVMYRKSTFDQLGGYDIEAGSAEDYDLWARMMLIGKIYVIPHLLFKWRLGDSNITTIKSAVVAHSAAIIRNRLHTTNPIEFSLSEINAKAKEYPRYRYLDLLNSYSRLSLYQIKNRLPYGMKNLLTLRKSQPYGKRVVLNRLVEIASRGKRSLNDVSTQ